jgi:DNA mismatch repair ATPase MutS
VVAFCFYYFVALHLLFCKNLSIKQYYENQIAKLNQEIKQAVVVYNSFSNFRLALLVGGFAIMYVLFQYAPEAVLIFVPAWLIGFYFLVLKHTQLETKKDRLLATERILQNELDLELNQKVNIYDNGQKYQDEFHPFSGDLDLFGDGSLFALVNRCKTYDGQNLLAKSILKPKSKLEIEEYQHAIQETKNIDTWRQAFAAVLVSVKSENTESLKNLVAPPKFKLEGLLPLYPFVSWLFLGIIIYSFYTNGPETGFVVLAGAIAFNASIVGLNRKISEPYFREIGNLNRNLAAYREAVEQIRTQAWEQKLNVEHAEKLNNRTNPIDEFSAIARKLEMRKNQFAALFLYMASPFDLVQLGRLKKWISQNPNFFTEILESIAWFEYASSFGTLAFNKPNWVVPQIINQSKPSIVAKELAHPLLLDAVPNDFDWNTSNALSIITGSNMSGKSTFLRTVGINTVLAYCGSVVYANQFQISENLAIHTYMRIKDSLQQNASTFKAEIDRLKMLIEAIKNQPNAILLVDEMLRGTNSEDKLKGSAAFLELIAKEGAFAMLATHDLRVTDIATKYPNTIKNYFFEYQSENNELRFDYKIKPGICQSFNATELLRSAGLIL